MLYQRKTTSLDANTNFRVKFYIATTATDKTKNVIYNARTQIDNTRIVNATYTTIIMLSNKMFRALILLTCSQLHFYISARTLISHI